MKKALLIALAILCVVIVYNIRGNQDTPSQSKVRETKAPLADQWYQGGNLHKEQVSLWLNATDKNKLATCADFAASVNNKVSMTELRARAEELKTCIDEAVADQTEYVKREKVSTIAASCLIVMDMK